MEFGFYMHIVYRYYLHAQLSIHNDVKQIIYDTDAVVSTYTFLTSVQHNTT